MRLRLIWALGACVCVCAVSDLYLHPDPTPGDVDYPVTVRRTDPPSEVGRLSERQHEPLGMVLDISGVQQPEMLALKELRLDSDEEVIGVVFEGRAFAFVKRGMNDPTKHIANLLVNGKPLSVTYCSIAECTRVVTTEDCGEPLDLRVGGLDIHSQLVLLFEKQRFGQESTHLPLEDHPFEETTLGDWTMRHPLTSVFLGDLQANGEHATTEDASGGAGLP